MPVFEYGQTEIDYLKRKDKKLAALIDQVGMIERAITPDPFAALVTSVIGQQISSKAAQTVSERLCQLVGTITPDSIAAADLAAIQACGMTMKKAIHIKGIADAALSGTVDFDALRGLPDEQIIKQLSALDGVGVWTAEMLLIFSLCRPDVVSYNDLAIRRGMMKLYGHKELPRQRFERYRKRYSPYGTVASLYLWALAGQ
ncbi:MAG TPA: DNA-3-methyladenine glycosylase 2 family protein [Firmicutes bacterium]|jgi:DNA-3-methyladenine glycosylase II|nr:DNA-3-methyladenine glycosylase 2 family protein [Bacillota bacterium]